MAISTKPLVHHNFTTTQSTSLPYNCVVCIADSPSITWFVPNRMLTANYYDTSVHSVSLPIVHTLPPNLPLPLGDTLVIADAGSFSGGIAPRDGTLFHYTTPTTVDIYRGDAGEEWTIVAEDIPLVGTNHTEERLLPICVTNAGIIAHELVMDCHHTNEMLLGQIARVGDTVLRIPVVGFPGEQAGLIDIKSITAFDINTIDRFFITNNLQEDLFPYSSSGRHAVFHIITIASLPYCVIYYSGNYSIQSVALPITNLISISGSINLQTIITGPLVPVQLTALGGITEGTQYNFTNRNYYVSKANPFLDIKFNLELTTVSDAGYPYLVVSINTLIPNNISAEYPGLLVNLDNVFVVFDLRNKKIIIRQPNSSQLNACSGGCEIDENGMGGDWHIRIQPLQTGSILFIYQNEILIDYASLPALDSKRMVKPHLVSWYINGTGEALDINLTVQDSMGVIPSQTERNMCIAQQATGIVSPCMDTPELLSLIPYASYVSMESQPVGVTPTGQIIGSTPAGMTWKVLNGAVPSQIIDEGLIDSSAKSLYLSDNSSLSGTTSGTTEIQYVNFRAFVRLTTNNSTDLLVVTYTPTNLAEVIKIISVRAMGADGWMVSCRYKGQGSSSINTNIPQLLKTDAIQANTLYCLVLTVDDTSITLSVNGKSYTVDESGGQFTYRMFKQGAVPLNTLSMVVTTQQAIAIDDILVQWETGWTPLQAFALNNDINTRPVLVDCDFQSLLTDINKRPIYLPGIPIGYGGTIRATMVNSYQIESTNQVQVYSVPAQYGFALVDVVFTCSATCQLTLCYGNQSNTVLYRTTLTSDGGGVKNIRLARGMGLYVKVTSPITIRVTSLLG